MPAIGTYAYTYPATYKDSLTRFSDNLLESVKRTLRQSTTDFDDEIKSYIETCAEDLHNAGIDFSYFDPPGIDWKCDRQILQAVRWYCLSVFGLYNTDSDKYMKSYSSLKATLATQNKYREKK